MNVNKININQSEQSYYISSDIYDITANNNGATFESLSTVLSDENLSTLIPLAVRYGGMTIRFVQSSDNKYVQYRLMTTSFSTTESDWEDASIIGTDRISNKAVTTAKIANPNTLFVLNVDNPTESLIKQCDLANAVIKHIYLDLSEIQSKTDIYKLDENGLPQIFLRQILYKYEGLPDRVWLQIERNDGDKTKGVIVTFDEERGVGKNPFYSTMVSYDKSIIPSLITSINDGQIIFNDRNQIKLNLSKLETKEFYFITDEKVTTEKIADNAITTSKIADNAITTTTITNHAVTTDKLDGTISASILYTNALNDSIKNSWVLEQTTTNNMAVIFK